MEMLLQALKTMPVYQSLLASVQSDTATAIVGIGQINRSHLIAGLHADCNRPIVLICSDDSAAKQLQEELKAFTGFSSPVLPSRELTLYDSAAVSRSWEQKRLRQLYALKQGQTPIQILPWESLSQRTIPSSVLLNTVFSLAVGETYQIDDLVQKLTNYGYSRCSVVEGVGQFAVRGGILDVYSPAADQPVRMEFFDDELDAIGLFDTDTQRRTENIDTVTVLPVGETQPALHPEGIQGLCNDISYIIAKQKRKKVPNTYLISVLEKDLEKFENNIQNPAADRYLS